MPAPASHSQHADFLSLTETAPLQNSSKASYTRSTASLGSTEGKKMTKCSFLTKRDSVLSCIPEASGGKPLKAQEESQHEGDPALMKQGLATVLVSEEAGWKVLLPVGPAPHPLRLLTPPPQVRRMPSDSCARGRATSCLMAEGVSGHRPCGMCPLLWRHAEIQAVHTNDLSTES